jgi:hypothetical protein
MSIDWSAMPRTCAALVTLSAAGLLTACGDATGPETTGSVQAYVADESPSGGSPVSGQEAETAPSRTSHGSGSYSGTLEADAQVSISAGGDIWVDLGSPSSASLDLQASTGGVDVHGQVEVPVGVYTRVRLSLSGAQARLDAGGTIGGITLRRFDDPDRRSEWNRDHREAGPALRGPGGHAYHDPLVRELPPLGRRGERGRRGGRGAGGRRRFRSEDGVGAPRERHEVTARRGQLMSSRPGAGRHRPVARARPRMVRPPATGSG